MSKVDELKAKNENLFERNTILLNENERLKKENAELKSIIQETKAVDESYAKLQMENTELKEQLNFKTRFVKGEKAIEQLSIARDIIERFMVNYENKTIYVDNVKPLLEQAEQFLKEGCPDILCEDCTKECPIEKIKEIEK